MLLNTSFNENEPVVCRPEEALACFLRTKMDVLVMGSFFLERKEDGARSLPPRVHHAADKVEEVGAANVAPADDNGAGSIPAEAHAIARRLADSFNAEHVYLFGSYARGSAGPDSDLDFLVVVPHSKKTRYQRAVDALGFVSDVHFPADIIVLTQNEWDRDLTVVCSLASAVRREGILLNGRQKS